MSMLVLSTYRCDGFDLDRVGKRRVQGSRIVGTVTESVDEGEGTGERKSEVDASIAAEGGELG